MKVFVTKYALSEGIRECETSQDPRPETGNVSVVWPGGDNNTLLLFEGEWHQSRVMAEMRADEMRTKKIASLKKQIGKLERMTF